MKATDRQRLAGEHLKVYEAVRELGPSVTYQNISNYLSNDGLGNVRRVLTWLVHNGWLSGRGDVYSVAKSLPASNHSSGEQQKKATYYLTEPCLELLRTAAFEDRQSQSEIVQAALDEYLERRRLTRAAARLAAAE